MKRVVTAILGGGQGARLAPLTRDRAKPAVPVGGKFRLIDIPISNSLHAGIDKVYVLTQFNSESLHRHIAQSYRFDAFRGGFVNLLAAEQNMTNRSWYQGTADAVRQNLTRLIDDNDPTEVLILSGDQLYLMEMREFVLAHRANQADLTIAVKPVTREEAKGFGILRLDRTGRVVEFVEKPTSEDGPRRPGARRIDPRRARLRGAARVAPRQHGDLRLPARSAARGARREPLHRLRQGGHPGLARPHPRLRLPLRRLLDRHRDDPELPPGQSRPHRAAAGAQPLQPELPDLHPRPIPPGHQDQRLLGDPLGALRGLDHHRRQDLGLDRRHSRHRADRHHDRALDHHGRQPLRAVGRGGEPRRARPASAATARSATPSSTSTPASATAASS